VIDSGQLALINADIDGELDAGQRAELARLLLADPKARALRDGLKQLCQTLDAVELVEPPSDLRDSILAAVPQRIRPPRRSGLASRSTIVAWRYAAMLAAILIAGGLLSELARSPGPPPTEVVGTIALAPAATLVDTVQLGKGPISGRVSLYRDRATLALRFEITANTPLAARIASEGLVLRIDGVGLGAPDGHNALGAHPAVPLPGVPMNGQNIEVTLLSDGHAIGTATLRAPRGP
jgi:hypothetical protein